MPAQPSVSAKPAPYDVVVVGAGFAGMYMLHRLRNQGMTVRVYEQGDGVGGTWYWNRYPGARCDVESMQYSYSFSDELQQEWDWSERYAPQPEILKYANHVADRFNLRPDIQFNTTVERAVFDEAANLWSVTISDGGTVTARFVVLATGCLSNAKMPDIRGLDRFKGKVYHTGHWPHEEVDFSSVRVGGIFTGSSAIQSVPIIAELLVAASRRRPPIVAVLSNLHLLAQAFDQAEHLQDHVLGDQHAHGNGEKTDGNAGAARSLQINIPRLNAQPLDQPQVLAGGDHVGVNHARPL